MVGVRMGVKIGRVRFLIGQVFITRREKEEYGESDKSRQVGIFYFNADVT